MKDSLIKIYAERLLGIIDKGNGYDENFRQFCEVLSDYTEQIREKHTSKGNSEYKRIDDDYPIREITQRSGTLERGFPIKLIDSNEERFEDPTKIEEL